MVGDFDDELFELEESSIEFSFVFDEFEEVDFLFGDLGSVVIGLVFGFEVAGGDSTVAAFPYGVQELAIFGRLQSHTLIIYDKCIIVKSFDEISRILGNWLERMGFWADSKS